MMSITRFAAVAIAAGWLASPALGAEFRLIPISADGAHTISGNEIQLDGGGQRVFFELRLTGWSPDILKAFQTTIDGCSYSNQGGVCNGGSEDGACCAINDQCPGGTCVGAGTVILPAVVPCADNPTCVAAFGTGATCRFTGFCNAGFIDTSRSNWVFTGVSAIPAMDASFINYRYGGVAFSGGATDKGSPYYAGTLVIDVPSNASGTYEIEMLPGESDSFLLDTADAPILPLNLFPARVIVLCSTNADCNDNNACTTDICAGDGTCSNTPNYNTTEFCCNPANGALTPLDDGNECTANICNPSTGEVTHPNLTAGTSCGDPSNTACDLPDTCDGFGVCQDNLQPAGTACGSPVNTECNLADTCDGAGTCLTNIQPAGTPCGDPSSGPCDNPDTCNGLGACLTNQIANGTPCDDGLFCTVGTTCSGGVCSGGAPRNCADSLTCTTDTCNEDLNQCEHSIDPLRCLIGGVCYVEGAVNPANTCEECDSATTNTDWTVLPDGTLCNDGDACTGTGREGIGFDTCTEGVCFGLPDPECNDNCDFAVEITEGTTVSNNESASPIDDGEASCQPDSNNDVWFKYTAICDGSIFLSTSGSVFAPSNDSVLNVFDDCPANGGVELACDDDSGAGLHAALIFSAVGGETYYIRVAGFEDNVGDIALNLRPVDDCLIDGVCYKQGALNPENPCLACIPAVNTTNWSPLAEGTLCGDMEDSDCNSPDACDGAGVCETNFKPDGTLCSDEDPPNPCTKNFCESGVCIHPPEPAGLPCGDPSDTECDNPDTCDGGGSCVPNYEDAGFPCGDPSDTECDNPDTCDGAGECLINLEDDGVACDDFDVCTHLEECEAGVCVGIPIPEAPLVSSGGARRLNVTPQPPASAAPVALRLTSPDDWPCVDKYINVDGTLTETAVFQLPAAWGTVLVLGPEIVPSSQYEVVAECGIYTSAAGIGSTALFGDVNNDGKVDITDISILVLGFGGTYNVPFYQMDIHPCTPNGVIDILDIAWAVDAFGGGGFPCPGPCP